MCKPNFVPNWDSLTPGQRRRNGFRAWDRMLPSLNRLTRTTDPNLLFFKNIRFGSIDITVQRSLGPTENPTNLANAINAEITSGSNTDLQIFSSGVVTNSIAFDKQLNPAEIGIIIGSISAFSNFIII